MPTFEDAEVNLKTAPILLANSVPTSLVTSSLSNKSYLFPAIPNTIILINYLII